MKTENNSPLKCLVLGGSGYVGSSVCRQLAGQGAEVAFTYFNNGEAAGQVERECRGSRAYRLDGADFDAVQEVVQKAHVDMGGLDALVQCIGTAGDPDLYKGAEKGAKDKFLDISGHDLSTIMNITANSTFAACQAFTRLKKGSGGGNIVIISSIDGVKPVPAPVHYASAKGALTSMTMALAKELGKYGIKVNLLALGILEEGIASLLSDELKSEYIKHSCSGRLGKAQEVANTVSWFISNNTYITGRSIVLDGGL